MAFNSHAGLYKCESPDAEPKLIEQDSKVVSYTTTAPDTVSYANDASLNLDAKKPFLIYYAIDSEEPFMKLSVNYELAELRRACESSNDVNYVAFLNSEMYWGEFSYCKDKKFYEVKIDKYPEFKEKFELKRKAIWEGDQSNVISSPLKFVSRYSDDLKQIFYQYPLAHPDFLFDLVELAITKEELFPSKEYLPFINLKSHGNIKSLLTGLQKCQLESKKKSQQAILEKVLDSGERMMIDNKLGFYLYHKQWHSIIEKVALGSTIAAKPGDHLGDYSLGEYSLGEYSLGDYSLGDMFSGLGSGEGLGSEFSFGTSQSGLSTVLNRLFNENNEKFVGFVMLESCDTNRKASVHQKHLPNVLGVYSAKSSLWYRNLNWWELMLEAKGSSGKLFELVRSSTSNIRNIVIKDK